MVNWIKQIAWIGLGYCGECVFLKVYYPKENYELLGKFWWSAILLYALRDESADVFAHSIRLSDLSVGHATLTDCRRPSIVCPTSHFASVWEQFSRNRDSGLASKVASYMVYVKKNFVDLLWLRKVCDSFQYWCVAFITRPVFFTHSAAYLALRRQRTRWTKLEMRKSKNFLKSKRLGRITKRFLGNEPAVFHRTEFLLGRIGGWIRQNRGNWVYEEDREVTLERYMNVVR